MGAVSSVVEAVGDAGQGLIDVVSDAGSALDDAVRENIPGGWAIPIAVATAGALAPEAFGAAAAGEAAGAGLAEGAFPGLVEGAVASDAGIAALAPEAAAAVTSPVTSGAVAESAIPPVEYAPEVNIGTAAPYVPEYAPEVNVGTAAPPMNEGIAALPAEPVSGMDLAADATKGNTIAEAGQGIAALPAEPVSGMDLAADATPGNTITEAGTAVGAPTGLTTDANQTAAETNRLLGQEATAAGTPTGTTPGWLGGLADATGIPVGVLNGLAASLGISALGNALQPGTVTNAQGSYTGPLANIQYNPGTYTPYTYKPYAGGGAVEGMSNANAIGANTGFPMADIQRGGYSTPYQQPISQNVVTGDQDTRVDPYTGAEMFASGGIANLGGYSDGGRLLRGPGDGVSDSIPAMIGNRQPARLADGEFVIPARIVSEIGNGSTDAGARKLYEMMDRVQAARRKTTGKGKFAANTKADKYLPT